MQVCDHMCEVSSVQLRNFLRADLAELVLAATRNADKHDELGQGQTPKDYLIGTTDNGTAAATGSGASSGTGQNGRLAGGAASWTVVGPPHKRRHLVYRDNDDNDGDDSPLATMRKLAHSPGALLHFVRR